MFENLIELLSVPNRLRDLEGKVNLVAELTQRALAELASSIDEVANELDEYARQVETNDADTAAQIMGSAERLRNLRPDTPPPGEVENPDAPAVQ